MELSFASERLRKAALTRLVAEKVLGKERARDFLGLVADMRDAISLGELADTPTAIDRDGTLLLVYAIGDEGLLETVPVGHDGDQWSNAHRIKLVRVVVDGSDML